MSLATSGGDPGLTVLEATPFYAGPGIPLNVALEVVDSLWFGLDTGFGIGDFTDASDTVFVPAGLSAGATLPAGGRPVLDVEATFAFPHLVLSGSNDALVTDFWAVGARISVYVP